MSLVDSEASSSVNTNELLEFIDTMDMDESENTKQSETTVNSEQTSTSENPTEQTSADPKSESIQLIYVLSSSLDPSTIEQELSKSPIQESIEKNDPGVNDQLDVSSHDKDVIAY